MYVCGHWHQLYANAHCWLQCFWIWIYCPDSSFKKDRTFLVTCTDQPDQNQKQQMSWTEFIWLGGSLRWFCTTVSRSLCFLTKRWFSLNGFAMTTWGCWSNIKTSHTLHMSCARYVDILCTCPVVCFYCFCALVVLFFFFFFPTYR